MKKTAKIFSIIALCLVFLCILASAFAVFSTTGSKDYVKLDLTKLSSSTAQLRISDKNDKLFLKSSKNIDISQLNPYTINAFIAVEDNRFFSHNGIDPIGIARAVKNNLLAGKYKEGASTITQQLIKNTHLTNDKTMRRKINEMLLSQELEQKLDKKEIMQAYLNSIYFGGNAYGIENASQMYFNKSAKDLTLSESATLAGIVNSPNSFLKDKQRLLNRRNSVLSKMLKYGYITKEEYDLQQANKISVDVNAEISVGKDFFWAVEQECCDILGVNKTQLRQMNLTIKTFYDEATQKVLEQAVKDNKDNAQKLAVAVDNANNAVCAFYGVSLFDLLSIRRQVGSVAKPLCVYAPALEEKLIAPLTPVFDEQTDFNGYAPSNPSQTYYGWTNIATSVAKSLNVPSVKTLNSLGVDKSLEYMRKQGIDVSDIQEKSLVTALGSFTDGLRLIDVLQGYLTLANKGTFGKLHFVQSITDASGREIYRCPNDRRKVFGSDTSYLMTEMLVEVGSSGTAKSMRNAQDDYAIAVKTGTCGTEKGNSDAMICAYTNKQTFLVWLGAHDGTLLPNNVTGNYCGNILRKITDKVCLADGKSFERPDSIVQLRIDSATYYDKHIILQTDRNENTISGNFSINNLPPKLTVNSQPVQTEQRPTKQKQIEQAKQNKDKSEEKPFSIWDYLNLFDKR